MLEVGLGGRLDATNIVTPAVTCVAQIQSEHTHIRAQRSIDRAREGGDLQAGCARVDRAAVRGGPRSDARRHWMWARSRCLVRTSRFNQRFEADPKLGPHMRGSDDRAWRVRASGRASAGRSPGATVGWRRLDRLKVLGFRRPRSASPGPRTRRHGRRSSSGTTRGSSSTARCVTRSARSSARSGRTLTRWSLSSGARTKTSTALEEISRATRSSSPSPAQTPPTRRCSGLVSRADGQDGSGRARRENDQHGRPRKGRSHVHHGQLLHRRRGEKLFEDKAREGWGLIPPSPLGEGARSAGG